MTVLDVLEVIMECCESYNRTEERKITVDQVKFVASILCEQVQK